jgi:hypothetical protein
MTEARRKPRRYPQTCGAKSRGTDCSVASNLIRATAKKAPQGGLNTNQGLVNCQTFDVAPPAVIVGGVNQDATLLADRYFEDEEQIARLDVRTLRPTRPAGLTLRLAEPSCDGPTRDDHLDFAPRHTLRVSRGGFWQGMVLTGRKPLLLLRFAGALLLRLAERTFDA